MTERRGAVTSSSLLALVRCATAAVLLAAVARAPTASADVGSAQPAPSASPPPAPAAARLTVHATLTQTQQYHGAFPAARSGANSLANTPDTAKTTSGMLLLGLQLGSATEIDVDPELDQGFGLGNPGAPGGFYNGTLGAGGFFSGEAYKIGSFRSYARIQRAFVRATLAAQSATHRVTITAGKFSVTDVFDTNVYAHDPSSDFLNWSVIDMGAFDYAADAWGYTYGISAEYARGASTVRAGLFQLSTAPNEIAIEPRPFLEYSPMVEFEQRTSLFGGHPGTIKALVYADDGFMGAYADAVAAAAAIGATPETASVRGRRVKIGGGLNLAQEVAPYVGIFGRISAMNGTYEAYDFTEIDRSLVGGISLDGGLFRRPNDTLGIAGAINGLSTPAQAYFAAGGIGILIGDGDLAYTPERLIETYYRAGIGTISAVTFDYQRLAFPGYNRNRGPVSVFGLRYHIAR